MLFYDYFRSSAAYRVRIALNLKGLVPERRSIHLLNGEQHSAAFRAINPQGFVPYLVEDNFALSQSLASIEYLDETHPTPPLMPASAQERATVRQIAQIIACDIHPVNNKRILDKLTADFAATETAKASWYCGWIQDGFVAIEALLAARGAAQPFCIGEAPTLADICLVPQVANAFRYKCSLTAFPRIMAIYHHALTLPAFDQAQPARQPDAV
jgi:maleylacetoacetate isomerase